MPTLIHQILRSRDIQQEIQSLPDTLSSWDKCMAKDFCKYPVIAGCIIGGIILISLVWCFIRCCMCGYACCSCCCGGCGGRKSKAQKHQVEFVPVHPPPPLYQPPAYREEPQYAYTTDRSGNVSADALPAMPEWKTTQVEVKEEMELGYVNNDGYKSSPGMNMHGGAGYNNGYTAPPPQQRQLTTPALTDPYARQQSPAPTQRVLSPGPMAAPQPVNPSGQKMNFQSPPGSYQYEDRDPIQGDYGYTQQGPRWGNQAPAARNQYDRPLYDDDAPELVIPPHEYGANADYYNAYNPTPQSTNTPGGGYSAYSASRSQPGAQAPYPNSHGQSMYPVNDRPYDYDDPNRRKQDPWSAV